MELVAWNEECEKHGVIKDYEEVYHQFLWGSDPYEKFHPSVMFNRNHLLGLLVCRAAPEEHGGTPEDRMTLMSVAPEEMNLRQLKDTFTNIQLEWPSFINKRKNIKPEKIDAVRQYVHSCMRRFGQLVARSWPADVLNDVADTTPSTEKEDAGTGLVKLTVSAIRRVLAAILCLHRHMDLYDMCQVVVANTEEEEGEEPYKTGVSPYHHEASNEQFQKMCMHYHLPVAGKMQYKHDFPGMYNDVSQAVYFHDSQYQRKKRDEYTSTNPLHMLPSVCLLYPEVTVKYEDDFINPYEATEWYWLLLPQRIYLVGPDAQVYYSEDLSLLLKLYVQNKKE
jgi:hypothetical protein